MKVYVLQDENIVVTQGRRVLNENSLELEQKKAKYHTASQRLEIHPLSLERGITQKEETHHVNRVLSLSRAEYSTVLQSRRASVQEHWKEYLAADNVLVPYIGKRIPRRILKKRDQIREAVPKPYSLLNLILQKVI